MKKKLLSGALAVVLILALLTGLAAAASPYSDVEPGSWYAEDVAYATEHGLMDGVADGKFEPYGTTTRAMIVTILHRLEGKPAAKKSAFADVPAGAWFADAVNWAAEKGIVNGMDEQTFAPNSPITREQMATILYRYANYKQMDVSKKANLSRFADAGQISPWALDAMRWANAVQLINGTTAVTLEPGAYAPRAHAASVLSRFDRMVHPSGEPTPEPTAEVQRVTIKIDQKPVIVTESKQTFTGSYTVENDTIARVDWTLHSGNAAYDGRTGSAVLDTARGTWSAAGVLLAPGANRVTFTAVTESGVTAEATITVRCFAAG